MRGPASSSAAEDGQAGPADEGGREEGVKDAKAMQNHTAVDEDEEEATGDAFWQERDTTNRPSSSRGGVEQDKRGFEEGLRMRRREYDMPGAMPGMIPN